MYFSNWVLFQWIDIHHSFKLLLCLIVTALTRHFKGHLKILTSMLYQKSHYLKSHYQHSISNGIGIAKTSFFSYKIFLEKIEYIYPMHLNILFLFSYLASISFWCHYLFLYNFLPIHSKASIGVLDKWMFKFLETPFL